MGGTSPLPILLAPHHGGLVGVILWSLIQRLPQGHSGRPTLPHHFEYCDGYSDQALDDGGGKGGGGTGSIW